MLLDAVANHWIVDLDLQYKLRRIGVAEKHTSETFCMFVPLGPAARCCGPTATVLCPDCRGRFVRHNAHQRVVVSKPARSRLHTRMLDSFSAWFSQSQWSQTGNRA